jgi:hypothetical protein
MTSSMASWEMNRIFMLEPLGYCCCPGMSSLVRPATRPYGYNPSAISQFMRSPWALRRQRGPHRQRFSERGYDTETACDARMRTIGLPRMAVRAPIISSAAAIRHMLRMSRACATANKAAERIA